jgi:hypothetical protein
MEQHLLDWFQEIPFTDIVRIYPHSKLLDLRGDEMQEELAHLSESWCRKSIEERDLIKQELSMKAWEELGWEMQEILEQSFFIPEDKKDLFVDEFKRPYTKTVHGKIQCSARKEYEYSIKNK